MRGIAGTITEPSRAPLHTIAATAAKQVVVTVILTDNDAKAPGPAGLREDHAKQAVLGALQAGGVVTRSDGEPGRYTVSGIQASALG
jgi:hypothetical protein